MRTFLTGMTVFIGILLVMVVTLLVINIRQEKVQFSQRQKNHMELINAVRGI